MDQIRSLYEQEIEAYKGEMTSLRSRNRECDAKNLALMSQVKNLEEELQRTKQANNDLRTAYQHIHEENLKLKVPALSLPEPQPQPPAITANDNSRPENNAGEILSWVSDRDKLNQRVKFLERECVRYQRDNTTLGKQVRHLLRALEEERGMIIPHRSQPEQDAPVVSALDVIDKHLITFNSIEQLQQQNQQLISIVKDLSTEQELKDATLESEEVKKLTAQVEELSKQLESIKSDRERVLTALNTIHRERDLFKILLCKTREAENMTPEIFQRMVAVACSSGPTIDDSVTKLAEKESHINDLRDVNTRLQQEIDLYKKDIRELRQETIEEIKLKDSLLQQAHSKILDESKRADLLNDRNEVLEANIEALTREYDELRVKCNKMTFEMSSATEETAAKLAEKDEHIKDLREANTRLQQEIDSYKKDIRDLRQETTEEVKSKESLLQQAHSQILDEKKQADLLKERNEALERNIEVLEQNIDSLQKNIEALQKDIQAPQMDNEALQMNNEMLQRNIEVLQKDIDVLRNDFENLKKDNETLQKNNEALQKDNEALHKNNEALQKNNQTLYKSNETLTREYNELRLKCSDMNSHSSNSVQMSEDFGKLLQQFLEMQDLRNQEREMRLDLARRRSRPKTKKALKVDPVIQSNTTPQNEVPPEPQQEPEVKPAPTKTFRFKRRNLS